jgi:hypothetical protein
MVLRFRVVGLFSIFGFLFLFWRVVRGGEGDGRIFNIDISIIVINYNVCVVCFLEKSKETKFQIFFIIENGTVLKRVRDCNLQEN